MSDKSFKCVFDSIKECPVRKEIHMSLDAKSQIDKYIKPAGDEELAKMFAPIFDKMQQLMINELGILHNYCKICRR